MKLAFGWVFLVLGPWAMIYGLAHGELHQIAFGGAAMLMGALLLD